MTKQIATRRTVEQWQSLVDLQAGSGEVRNWQHIKEVSLNPGKPVSAEAKAA